MAGQLGELIRQGELAAGGRLPPERELARQLGVSRPVIREAMVALEIAGLVEIRTGSGIYVQPLDGTAQALVPPDAGPSPFDLIAARRLLEPEIASAATATATPADLEEITRTLEQMRAALAAGQNIRSADRLFHTKIAAATGNTVLAALVDQLWESSLAPIFDGLSHRVGLPENQRAAVEGHGHILAALEQRDAVAARDAMRAHLTQVEAIMMAEDTT